MGCWESKESRYLVGKTMTEVEKPKPKMSWEQRKVDGKDFKFVKENKQVLVKSPGSIDGKADFIIEDCQFCEISLLDYTVQITVDGCKSCLMYFGPCEGSVFIRNCTDSVFFVASQQFRMRDCSNCSIFLHVHTQPVIETSSDLTFGCYYGSYPQMMKQFERANLSIWENEWSNIHDFSKKAVENFKLVDVGSNEYQAIVGAFKPDVSLNKNTIPLQRGKLAQNKRGIIVIVNKQCSDLDIVEILNKLAFKLIRSKILTIKPSNIPSSCTCNTENPWLVLNFDVESIDKRLLESNLRPLRIIQLASEEKDLDNIETVFKTPHQ